MIASLPASQRAAVKARAKTLLAEEMTLQQARKLAQSTQEKVARRMGIGQDSVSQLEMREDMLVSSLRSYFKALGAKVHVMVEMKGREPFELKGIGTRKATKRGAARRKAQKAA
jgi:transcriptional regulator with XRE-family HTH domain